MFWIGMIVGIVIGVVGIVVYAVRFTSQTYGSWKKFGETQHLVERALDNRESVIVAYHGGEILGGVTYPEEG